MEAHAHYHMNIAEMAKKALEVQSPEEAHGLVLSILAETEQAESHQNVMVGIAQYLVRTNPELTDNLGMVTSYARQHGISVLQKEHLEDFSSVIQ